jgi:mono/diheme cytochrome c family protein
MNLLRSGLILALTTLAGLAHAQQPDGSFGSPFRFTENTGVAIYQGICAGCHMSDGRGAAGAALYPALSNNERLTAQAYPITMVLRGNKAMPGFARFLTDRQVADVVDYIRHSLGNDLPGTASTEDVKALR